MPGYVAGTSTVRALGPELERFFFARTMSHIAAKDLAQDVWVASVGFRGDSSFRHYMFSVARNVAAEWHRRRYRTEIVQWYERMGAGPLRPSTTSLGQRLHEKTKLETLFAAVRRLKEPYRETVLLSLRGLNGVEIGEQLGVPSRTIRSRLSRARAMLHRILVDDC